MRVRALSSVGVVVIGLVPALMGGWVFAVIFTAIALIAYREAITITAPSARMVATCGYLVVALAGLVAVMGRPENGLPVVMALTLLLPLAVTVFVAHTHGIEQWSGVAATTLYLALPTVAAITLRVTENLPAEGWLTSVAGWAPGGDGATGGGLAWFLMALFVTWLSDTFAYLVGRTWGRRKLIPRVSPNKTIEGAAGGLTAAALTAVACDALFGMNLGPGVALVVGVALGLAGQIGDLAESMLKRMRGVKDSGNLIPGHGGVLDRIDALLFAITTAWIIAPWLT